MLSKNDLRHVRNALEDALEEFNELMNEKEWFVTYVTDKLESAIEIITEELESYDQDRTSVSRQDGT